LNKQRALIIGGAGFVGGYLIDHLNDCGYEVSITKMCADDLHSDHCNIYNLDILNINDIISVLNTVRPDVIFHLAAQSSVALSWRNPQLTIDVNIKGTVNVLDTIKQMDYNPRILLIGSGEEYGKILDGECPITEENCLRPGNIYAVTKASQNMIGKIYADAYGMDIVMVRAFNHIGPNQSPIFVVADFCKQVAEIEKGLRPPVINVGNLSAKRDFTDVRDVVRAYVDLAQHGEKGEIYNVGSGEAVSIEDILKMILSKSRESIEVNQDPNKLRPVDVPIIEADISKLSKATRWERRIALKRTIEDTLDYWRNSI
jgi:GDP-4-dehydro-6-deoxy-D-mannose reductase